MEVLRYTVSTWEPHKHYFQIQVDVPALPPDELIFRLPVWTPGSYMVRDYSTHIHNWTVKSQTTKEPLFSEMADLHSWRIKTNGQPFRIQYRVYAFTEYSVRNNYLEDSFAYLHPTATFVYLDCPDIRPEIEVTTSTQFPFVYTSLWQKDANLWSADDWDDLLDNPILFSFCTSVEFEAEGCLHRLVVEGETPDGWVNSLASELKDIVSYQIRSMEGSPNKTYLFVLNLRKNTYGGLEHMRCSVNIFPGDRIRDSKEYKRLLELLSHEYFHLWNVKRIRPLALGPFDYQNPNLTRELWIAEGITSFFDAYFLLQTGHLDTEEYLSKILSDYQEILQSPAEKFMSLEESSWTAWTKYYKSNPNSSNTGVSYYIKGGLFALCLDIRIRELTGAKSNLLDVLKLVYQKYAIEKSRGFTRDEFFQACMHIAGTSIEDEFLPYLVQRTRLPVLEYLKKMGIQSKSKYPKGDFGLTLKEEGRGAWVVQKILGDGPAMEAGLSLEDEILGMDGYRSSGKLLEDIESNKPPGYDVPILFSRRKRLMTTTVKLGKKFQHQELFFSKKPVDSLPHLIYSSFFPQ